MLQNSLGWYRILYNRLGLFRMVWVRGGDSGRLRVIQCGLKLLKNLGCLGGVGSLGLV